MFSSTDDLVRAILSNPDPEALQLALSSTPVRYFEGLTSEDLDPLVVISPNLSLGYLYFLAARTASTQERRADSRILELFATFLLRFDPQQVRVASSKFVTACKTFSTLCMERSVPLYAVKPLVHATKIFSFSSAHLSGLHPLVLKHVLLAKCYKYALPILEGRISEIEPQQMYVTVTDHLLYHYYGGMVFIGMKRFKEAMDFFSTVLFCPSAVTSAIQIEAYKKYCLVSLLVHGKVLPLPKYCSPVVIRIVKIACVDYEEFASTYEVMNVAKAKTDFQKYKGAFDADQNLGLAKQALLALHRHRILRLTQTYLTLSLNDIAREAGFEGSTATMKAEHAILSMVENGDIYATISHISASPTAMPSSQESPINGMVSFHDPPNRYNDARTLRELADAVEVATEVGTKVHRAEREIATSKEYIARLVNPTRGGRGSVGDRGAGLSAAGDEYQTGSSSFAASSSSLNSMDDYDEGDYVDEGRFD